MCVYFLLFFFGEGIFMAMFVYLGISCNNVPILRTLDPCHRIPMTKRSKRRRFWVDDSRAMKIVAGQPRSRFFPDFPSAKCVLWLLGRRVAGAAALCCGPVGVRRWWWTSAHSDPLKVWWWQGDRSSSAAWLHWSTFEGVVLKALGVDRSQEGFQK